MVVFSSRKVNIIFWIVQIVFDSYNKILWIKGGDDLGDDFLSAVIDIVVDLFGGTFEEIGIDREGDKCE